MAAETLALRGIAVHLFEAMPSVGRKFLMAGKSGLNLTHSEPFADFLKRFGPAEARLTPLLANFVPEALREWADRLGVATFIGSSGRVFPMDFKAAPLLRRWLRRLRDQGVVFHTRHLWRGWDEVGRLHFETPQGPLAVRSEAAVLALGGASWPRLGSDGSWVPLLHEKGIKTVPLRPANCGFDIAWSDHFRRRFAGHPVKPVILRIPEGQERGEFVITEAGIEGSAVYLHAAALRDRIESEGSALLLLDLAPDRDVTTLAALLGKLRGSRSMAEHLRRSCGIAGVKAGLLREVLPGLAQTSPAKIATVIKALPLRLVRPRPIAEAISSAGGVPFAALRADLMIRDLPGVFCAGEMIDWEVRTGGYLLNACFALGRAAGDGAADWAIGRREEAPAGRGSFTLTGVDELE